jgi:hypothetical protein
MMIDGEVDTGHRGTVMAPAAGYQGGTSPQCGVVRAPARCIGRFGRRVPPSYEREFSERRLRPHSALISSVDDILLIERGSAP